MKSMVDILAGGAVEIVVAFAAGLILFRVWSAFLPSPKRMAIPALHAGVLFKGGQPIKVLQTGTYWVLPSRSLLTCDLRTRPFQIQSQTLRSADHRWLHVSLQGEYRVADPRLFLSINKDPFSSVFLEMKQALQTAAAENTADSIVDGSALLAERVKEIAVVRASSLGVELTSIGLAEAVSFHMQQAN